jgi:hypothetical protein
MQRERSTPISDSSAFRVLPGGLGVAHTLDHLTYRTSPIMLTRFVAFAALLLSPALFACDPSVDPVDDGDFDSGKADAVNAAPAGAVCPADVYVTFDANDVNNHVFANCHNQATGRYTYKACCAEDLSLIEDISCCPTQAKFSTTESAADKTCLNDVAGHAEQGETVPTACCAPLCDDTASFDEHGYCRTGLGHFEETLCCLRNLELTNANCIGAKWEAISGGNRDYACRAPNGQFALDACCADQCAAAITKTGIIPEGCVLDDLVAAEYECPSGSTPNVAGICHNPENGQFVKAACCAINGNDEGLDVQDSDQCWAGQQLQCG